MTRLFICGTDTNTGKTHVARALLSAASANNLVAVGYKPIESGCAVQGEPGPDSCALAQAAGHEPKTTYTFAPPIAPSSAAALAGLTIDISQIVSTAATLSRNCDLLIIEAAGGLLAPISSTKTIADLAIALGDPTLIIAADRLGAINHSLLSLEAARHRGISTIGLVLSCVEANQNSGLDNAQLIRDLAPEPVYSLPHTRSKLQLQEAGSILLQELFSNTKFRK